MEFKDNQPIYMQIADYFCENILTNQWKENEKIPSVREIAVQVEVNPNTAIRAYNFLQDQGIIYNKRGIGYFVSDDGNSKALEMRKQEFISKELPLLFKTIKLLNINFADLQSLYNKWLSE
jgi:DNA-binding transcriptional regulator YhcF (GntR family)